MTRDGAKASMRDGADDLEDHEGLAELIRVTTAALPAPRLQKPKKKTKTKATLPTKLPVRQQKR